MKQWWNPKSVLMAVLSIVVTAFALGQVLELADEIRGKDLDQLRTVWAGIRQYVADHDDRFPLAHGQRQDGTYAYNMYHYVPADWPSGQGGDPLYGIRIFASKYFWATSVLPYLSSQDPYHSPGTPGFKVSASNAQPGGPRPPILVSYTYPGTLSQYEYSNVQSPEKFPVLWQGEGRVAIDGASIAQPYLRCDTANVPCVFVPKGTNCASGNGSQSGLFTPKGSMWVYAKTATWLSVDGTATWRRLGARILPLQTDPVVDPFSGYNAQGFPSSYWNDLCHAWLFRPNAAY